MKKTPVQLISRKELGVAWPVPAKLLFDYYLNKCEGKPPLSFAVQMLPPSVNDMYIRGKHIGRGKGLFRLSDEANAFRQAVGYAIGHKRLEWAPKGTVAAVILFESPDWLTTNLLIERKDADNLVKALFDAVQNWTGIPDETNWQHHVFKVHSKRNRTIVYMFDLGNIVEFFG